MRFCFFAAVFFCLLVGGPVRGQLVFSGTVGTAPIELVMEDDAGDRDVQGLYMYTKYNAPIDLSGVLKGDLLKLTEKDAHGKPSATLIVPAFARANARNTGTWKSLATGRTLPLTLTQRMVVGNSSDGYALLQAASLPASYFRVVLTAGAMPTVSKVQVLDKKTGRLVQELTADCAFRGMHNVSVGDYNFDGLPDFAVFESSYAGPNTSSLYFLYNPASKRYVASGFSGVSLEFDAKKKRIYERNSCCAGSSVTMAEYKVVRNKMVLLAEHCYKWNEKQQKLVERKLSACQ